MGRAENLNLAPKEQEMRKKGAELSAKNPQRMMWIADIAKRAHQFQFSHGRKKNEEEEGI